MNIPPKYEDVVAQLEISQRHLDRMIESHDALQQRLTVAEQRAAVMEKALSRIAREHDCGCSPCTGSCTSQVALEITVDAMRDIAIAALKPAADAKPSRSCPNCKVCMGSPDFPENCLINGVKP